MSQCHQPLPVGASGSYTVTAKLFVSGGAFCHWSSGEILPPVQPKPEKTCSLPIFPLSFRTGLTKLKSAARPGKATSTKTSDNQNRNIFLLLSFNEVDLAPSKCFFNLHKGIPKHMENQSWDVWIQSWRRKHMKFGMIANIYLSRYPTFEGLTY